MFKLLRILIGVALGLWIANYFHVGGFSIDGLMAYVGTSLIVMIAVAILRGLHL